MSIEELEEELIRQACTLTGKTREELLASMEVAHGPASQAEDSAAIVETIRKATRERHPRANAKALLYAFGAISAEIALSNNRKVKDCLDIVKIGAEARATAEFLGDYIRTVETMVPKEDEETK